jgi:methylated-DNA-protein-cysteine methyltransferase-like protein
MAAGPLDSPVGGPGAVSDAVLDLVERIPVGRVMSYGMIAEVLGLASPRIVGNVMAREGGAVPWHRVVNSVGRLPPHKETEARARLLAEDVPFRGAHVVMREAAWWPGSGELQGTATAPSRRGSAPAPVRPTTLAPPK